MSMCGLVIKFIGMRLWNNIKIGRLINKQIKRSLIIQTD